MSTAPHIPVMLEEVLAALAPRDGEIYLDGTFGAGGYTAAILAAANCRVIALDRDPAAIAGGAALIERFGDRLILIEGRFSELDRIAAGAGIDRLNGVVLDLGVSSMQLDQPARGFSFRADGPLDMRMGGEGDSAADLVNRLDEAALADILRRFGEERHARRIARAIVAARNEAPITGTARLAGLVRGAVPPARDGIDPATRTFQALRIVVNDELGELEAALAAAERALASDGRLVVISFHSLEDRIVKHFMIEASGQAPVGSRHRPAQNRMAARFSLPGRKAVSPTDAEIAANPRARSARLRAALRNAEPARPGGSA